MSSYRSSLGLSHCSSTHHYLQELQQCKESKEQISTENSSLSSELEVILEMACFPFNILLSCCSVTLSVMFLQALKGEVRYATSYVLFFEVLL